MLHEALDAYGEEPTVAHTDRDDARFFWKHHYDRRSGECTLHAWLINGYYVRGTCWCDDVHNGWTEPYRYETGIPSWYHKDSRRQERARAKNLMRRARNAHIDWDDLVIAYRRPYYW